MLTARLWPVSARQSPSICVCDHGFAGDEEVAPSDLADPNGNPVVPYGTAITPWSYQQFEEFGHSRSHLYADGKMFGLDLAL